MLVEQALKQILSDDAGVVTLVGGKVFPGILSQSVTYPAVSYRQVHRKTEPVMDSATTTPPNSHFWFVSAAKGSGTEAYQKAKLIDEAIRLALQGYQGTVTLATSPPVSLYIQGIFFLDSADEYIDSTQTHEVGSLYAIRHEQQQP